MQAKARTANLQKRQNLVPPTARNEVLGQMAKPGHIQAHLMQSGSRLHLSLVARRSGPINAPPRRSRSTTSTLTKSQVNSPINCRCTIRWSCHSQPKRFLQNASHQRTRGANKRATMGRVALGFLLCANERGHFSSTPAESLN